MVADINKEREDMKGLPIFDSANMVTWLKTLKTWLMWKKCNHLGLEYRPARPPNNTSAAAKTEYRIALDNWLERKDTCVSAIYEAVEGIPDALEIADQYILPQDDPDKEVLASALLEKLVSKV